uniref:KH type-2 domain-containing protein n=1 Tax=Jaculus jaculus TaxID=51337 RepID=A0A8C5KV08_JACJA
MAVQISKKRKFVADGIFKAELNEFLTRELAEDGYSGVEVRVTPTRTEIIILATRTQNVLGEKGRRIRELTAVVQKRFGFPEGSHPPHCGLQGMNKKRGCRHLVSSSGFPWYTCGLLSDTVSGKNSSGC